jgi:hypothetical protein
LKRSSDAKKAIRASSGVIVAERKKLCFDERRSHDVRGNRLHNRTNLGRNGNKIVPTRASFTTAPRRRGRPHKMPMNADAVLEKWRCLADGRTKTPETAQADKLGVNSSDKSRVSTRQTF